MITTPDAPVEELSSNFANKPDTYSIVLAIVVPPSALLPIVVWSSALKALYLAIKASNSARVPFVKN